MPLINPRFNQTSNMVRTLTNQHFSQFYIKPKLLGYFQQLGLSLTKFDTKSTRDGPKNPNFDPTIKQVETKAIMKIIELFFQRLFMGQNWSQNSRDIMKTRMTHQSTHRKLQRAITFDPTIGFSSSMPFKNLEAKIFPEVPKSTLFEGL